MSVATLNTRKTLTPARARKKSGPKFELSELQQSDIKTAFEIFDTRCTGFIEAKQLRVAIRALGFEPKKEEIRRLMSDVGAAESGLLSFNDFLRVMTIKMTEKDNQEEIIKAFRLFDDDDVGRISFRNLKRVAHELGENVNDEELHEMIAEADLDQDGFVNEAEFLQIVKKTTLLN